MREDDEPPHPQKGTKIIFLENYRRNKPREYRVEKGTTGIIISYSKENHTLNPEIKTPAYAWIDTDNGPVFISEEHFGLLKIIEKSESLAA